MSTPRPRPLPQVAEAGGDLSAFGQQVRDALAHLNDPTHLQTHPLARLLPTDVHHRPESAGRALRRVLLDAIEALRPPRDTSSSSDTWRPYEVAALRYVEGLEIPEIQERLGVSRREYFREHRRTLAALVSLVQERLDLTDLETRPRAGGGALPVEIRVLEVPPPRHNLRLQLTSFVGREKEMAEVERLLGDTRLLTLTGTGGCGKTRLAYQVAEGLLQESPDQFPDGVWVAELASLSDPALVVQIVASSLGLREEAGEPILDTLLDYLRPKRLLLVLDNCEHLLDASARLADSLLRACPDLKVVTTSREALGIAGETSYRVPSLPLPDLEHLPPLDALSAYESLRLFADRAKSVQPSFALGEGNAPTVARICWRLDGVPLAIELAAARLRGLTVEQISRHLDDRFHLLTGGSRTALGRQQTLRSTIDWSYDLLSEPERVLFGRLAVFAGGWSLEAVEEVCADEVETSQIAIRKGDVLGLLLRLVDRSLVVAEEVGEEERYRFLETIRQYAQEKLADSGEMARLRDRHRDWCVRLLALGQDTSSARELRPQDDRLELEQDNLRAALAWCLKTVPTLGLELAASPSLPDNLSGFWMRRGSPSEGRYWFRELVARVPEHGAARAWGLVRWTWMASDQGDLDEAQGLAEEGLEISREIGDLALTVYALLALGEVTRLRGDREAARVLLEEARALGASAGEAYAAFAPSRYLGVTLASGGHYAEARACWEEALALIPVLAPTEQQAAHSVGITAPLLGYLDHLEGNHERGSRLLEESITTLRRVAGNAVLGWSVSLLGYTVGRAGDYERGSSLLRESLIRLYKLGHRLRLGQCLCLQAILDGDRGGNARAVRLIGAAMGIFGEAQPELFASERSDRESCLASARAALGDAAFARAWAEGQAMTLEQAVAYALADDET